LELSFKEYLEEGRDAPLYHGTSLHNAVLIMKNNKLLSNSDTPLKSISFTRSIKAANHFVFHGKGENTCVIFEVNQRKLTQRYKIEPYNFYNKASNAKITRFKGDLNNEWDFEGEYTVNEYEERIIAKEIKNISDYIIKIHIQTDLTLENMYKLYPDSVLAKDKRLIKGKKFINV